MPSVYVLVFTKNPPDNSLNMYKMFHFIASTMLTGGKKIHCSSLNGIFKDTNESKTENFTLADNRLEIANTMVSILLDISARLVIG